VAAKSIVGNRRPAAGVVAALAASVALASAPAALGAVDGDPINASTDAFKVTLSKGFKGQLKRNGVKMKPKKLKLKKGDVDPTTGQADLTLGKITFKKGKEKLVYSNLKGSLPGTLKGSGGKLFKLTAAKTVKRNGFGASLSGINVKFLKAAAKKINKNLGLNSLHKGNAGTMSLSYQPQTVKVLGGSVFVDVPEDYLPATLLPGVGGVDPNSVAAKQPSHCIDPDAGVNAIEPGHVATLLSPDSEVGPLPAGIAARFKFPVTGGTVAPAGSDGVIQVAGGIRLANGDPTLIGGGLFLDDQPSQCPNIASPGPSTSTTYLETVNLAPNLGLLNVQSNALIGGTLPGCWAANNPPGCGVFPGDKGPAIGQVLDTTGVTVSADPTAKTVTISGALIKNNPTSSLVLNGVFPNASGNSAMDFADGDKFGFSTLDVNTR
jgi:hypothetical protein